MSADRRRTDRISFERGFPATISSLDGKWRMPCAVADVSEEGARLTVKGDVDAAHLKEFILLLSANGKAFRRCELNWVKDSELGVRFMKPERRKRPVAKSAARSKEAAASADPVVEV